MQERIGQSSRNVFTDLEFSPEEAPLLALAWLQPA